MKALAFVLLLCVPSLAEAAQRNVTASGTWTGIAPFAGTATLDGALTTADEIIIPDGFTLTIPAGTTIDFSTGAGFVTNNGTLVVNGSLKMYNDASGTGTWTVTGTLKTCITSLTTCTVAGQSITSTVYGMSTLSSGQYVSGGWRLTYTANAWDSSGAAVGDILEYTDIDGNPANDSPAGALRPFFHIATVTPGSDLIETTYGVGSSYTDYTLAYNEGNASVAAAAPGAYVGDTAGAGAGVTAIDVPDAEPDNVDLDQTWTVAIPGPLDRSTTISVPTGTLTNNQDQDFAGQWICLNTPAADANCYLIWSSTDGGGGRDILRVWPPIKAGDYSAAAKAFTIGWGEPNRTAAGSKGLPLGEFLIFTPAQIAANRPGVRINLTTTGQYNETFALNGPKAGVAGYGVGITFKPTSVAASTLRHSWHTGLSNNLAGETGDVGYIATDPGATGTITADHVLLSHDFEPRNASSASTDPDTTSGPHGFSNTGNVTFNLTKSGCFKTGDACFVNSSSTPTTMSIRNGSCGWIDGKSSACVKTTQTTHTTTVDGLYMADVPSKQGMCDGTSGTTPVTAGTRCSSAATCAAASGVCLFPTGAGIDISGGGTAAIRNLVALPSDTDLPYATDVVTSGTTGSTNVTVDGGFIFDDRTDNSFDGSVMTMFGGVASVKHVSMPFAVQLGNFIVNAYSNNYAQRVRALGTGATSLLTFMGTRGANGAAAIKFENNVLLDIYDGTADDFIDFFVGTIPTGSTLTVKNNKVDRSRIAGNATQFVNLNSHGAAFGATASSEFIKMQNNSVAGYQAMLKCLNPAWPAASATLTFTGNVFAPASNVSIDGNAFVSYGCEQSSGTIKDTISANNQIVNRYRMMGGPMGGYTGPVGVAGYKQTKWLTSLGIQSVWTAAGGGKSLIRPTNTSPDSVRLEP